MGLAEALVPGIPLVPDPVVIFFVQVVLGFQDPIRAGGILKEPHVVFRGVRILIYALLAGGQGGEAPDVVIGVEVTEKHHLISFEGYLFSALPVFPAPDETGLIVLDLFEPARIEAPDLFRVLPCVFALQDAEGLPAQSQPDENGLDQFRAGHVGVRGIIELDQGIVHEGLLVVRGAGEEVKGDAGDVVGDGVDAGVNPDILGIGLGYAGAQAGEKRRRGYELLGGDGVDYNAARVPGVPKLKMRSVADGLPCPIQSPHEELLQHGDIFRLINGLE